MRILWIEDQSNDTEEEFFAESIRKHQICQEQKFDDAFETISNQIIEYDFVVLDLDLSDDGSIEDSKYAEKIRFKYSIEEEEFKKEAGYHLAVELIVKKGFPLERMIFLTGNTIPGFNNLINIINDICYKIIDDDFKGAENLYKSNRNEFPVENDETLKDIDELIKNDDWDKVYDHIKEIKEQEIEEKKEKSNFKTDIFPGLEKKFFDARIPMPEAIKKGEKEELENWFDRILKPSDEKGRKYLDYMILRRGILNMLKRMENENLSYYWKEIISKSKRDARTNQGDVRPLIDKNNFISTLKYFFRNHELSKLDNKEIRNKEEKQFYLTVCDFLTKIFEIYEFHELNKFKDKKQWYEDKSSALPAFFLRNWIAHGLFNGSRNDRFSAKDAAFTFLISVKGIFECKDMIERKDENRETFFELNSEKWPELEDFKLLFGDLEKDKSKLLEKIKELHNEKYETPNYITNKLKAISKRGHKDTVMDPTNTRYYNDMHWSKQDFIYNYYASYLFSSIDSEKSEGEIKGKNLSVNMKYSLVKTSLLEIAFKRLQEIEGN